MDEEDEYDEGIVGATDLKDGIYFAKKFKKLSKGLAMSAIRKGLKVYFLQPYGEYEQLYFLAKSVKKISEEYETSSVGGCILTIDIKKKGTILIALGDD